MLLNRSLTVGHLGGFQSWGEVAESGRLSQLPAMEEANEKGWAAESCSSDYDTRPLPLKIHISLTPTLRCPCWRLGDEQDVSPGPDPAQV